MTTQPSYTAKLTDPPLRATQSQHATEASVLRRLEAITERNKELRTENQELRRRLAIAHGQLRAQDQGRT